MLFVEAREAEVKVCVRNIPVEHFLGPLELVPNLTPAPRASLYSARLGLPVFTARLVGFLL